jgi:ribonucleoside-triphosphate reductase
MSPEETIKTLERQMLEVKGEPTEVYSRIVGYFRPISNWNNGKSEEYGNRKTYSVK